MNMELQSQRNKKRFELSKNERPFKIGFLKNCAADLLFWGQKEFSNTDPGLSSVCKIRKCLIIPLKTNIDLAFVTFVWTLFNWFNENIYPNVKEED